MVATSDQKKQPADLMEYRKRRKQRRLITKLVIVLLIFTVILIIAANFSSIIEPLRGFASRIDTKTSDEVGFPIKLPGSASYSFDSFGDSFLLLTDTYLYTFGMNGGQNYALRHGYSNPTQCSNSKRILLYDKDYNAFSLYSKTSLIYSGSVEEKIVFASLGSSEAAAIVTNSDRYSNIIYIYNGKGEWRYTRKFIDENVMNVRFSSEERYIYVSTIGVEKGEIYSAIYKYDTTNESDAIWSYRLSNSSIPLDMYIKGGRVHAVYDNYVVSLSETDGSVIGEREIIGTVRCCDFSDSFDAVVYNDTSTNRNVLAVFDNEMDLISTKVVNPNIDRVIVDGNNVFIVESGTLYGYNSEAEAIVEKPLKEDYVSFIKIGSSVLLLSYNSVDIENI